MTYRNAGINRLSLGLQSTDAEELKMLGRIHSYEEFLQSYQWAREAGFSNINIDLMFAIPGQTGERGGSTAPGGRVKSRTHFGIQSHY